MNIFEKETWFLYYLYDPRNNTVCYVGITKNYTRRIRQHLKPLKRNNSPIACLQRHLLTSGKTICGSVIAATKNKHLIDRWEKSSIKRLKRSRGSQIKNIMPGGFCYVELTKEQRVAKSTYIKNNPINKKRGEDLSNLTDDNVLEIYKLVKLYYSNTEIIKMVDFSVSRTQICNIRSGVNWAHLYNENNMVYIPSIPNNGGYSGNEKIDIIHKLSSGYSVDDIKLVYKNISKSDLLRIRDRRIWDKSYYVYDNFFNNLNK